MNEFILGTLVGSVQTIIGHPLDTLKTNFQSNKKLSLKNDAIKKLYRGVSYPLTSSIITNGFLFYWQDIIDKKYDNKFYSGFISGFLTGPLINCFEVYKVKEQLKYKGKINFLSGLSATIPREAVGASIYFGTYYKLKEKYHPFISGSLAGLFSWFFTYPLDVIKTRLQSGEYNNWRTAIYKGNFSSGLGVCLLRSFIVNGFSFSVYDYFKED